MVFGSNSGKRARGKDRSEKGEGKLEKFFEFVGGQNFGRTTAGWRLPAAAGVAAVREGDERLKK